MAEAISSMMSSGASLALYRPGTMKNHVERDAFLAVATWSEKENHKLPGGRVKTISTPMNTSAEGDTIDEAVIRLHGEYRKKRNLL